MAVDRFWHWRCDICGKIETRSDHGLPQGWIFIKDRTITHACPDCVPSVPREKRGISITTARN